MLVLPSVLMHSHAQPCLKMLMQGMQSQGAADVLVDAGALKDFDSTALAVLLELRRECLAMGKQLVIRGLSARLADLAALYGVSELLPTI